MKHSLHTENSCLTLPYWTKPNLENYSETHWGDYNNGKGEVPPQAKGSEFMKFRLRAHSHRPLK